MTDFQYKRPPITEAAIEFRSSTLISQAKRNKSLKQFKKLYTEHDPVKQQKIEVKIESEGGPKMQTTDSILDRFSADDMTKQLHISDGMLLESQLAPYVGWNHFKDRITRDWDVWRSVVGFWPLERIGMRYINRIDIPIDGDRIGRYEDYINVYPTLPQILDPSIHHSVNVKVKLNDLKSVLILKSAVVESPLPNNFAIVVDLDIVRNYHSPPNDDEIFSFLSNARIKKNEIFEACVTDKARRLFNE